MNLFEEVRLHLYKTYISMDLCCFKGLSGMNLYIRMHSIPYLSRCTPIPDIITA